MVICGSVFGGSTSAFLPLIAHRLAVPAGEPPRFTCAECNATYQDWVRVGKPCGCESVPWRTVAAGAIAGGLLPATLEAGPLLLVLLPATVPGVLLALIDFRCLRLPNPVVGALALIVVPALSALGLLGLLGSTGGLLRAFAGAGFCFVAYTMLAVLPRAGLGFGDVKLSAVLGFVLAFQSWPTLAAGLVLPQLINGPVAMFLLLRRRASRRTELPLGPALLVGALLAVALT
jgi:leader peptidase (prepilin peptidase)/N-methyltransferase